MAWKEVFRTATFGLISCEQCESYRIDPPPVSSETESASFYDSYYEARSKRLLVENGAESPSAASSRFWNVIEREPDLPRRGSSLLDIGCGDGHLCAQAAQAGWQKVVGVDLSASRVEAARRQYPHIEFYCGTASSPELDDRYFDMIVMDNVIEHVLHPRETLSNIRRLLRRDGWLAVITPNMESGNFRLLGRRWTPELAPHAHVYLFTPVALTLCLQHAGFHVPSIGSFAVESASAPALVKRFISGDVRGAVWRAMQESGAAFGRLTGNGAMLYAIAQPKHSDE